jgi:hypothetical protein
VCPAPLILFAALTLGPGQDPGTVPSAPRPGAGARAQEPGPAAEGFKPDPAWKPLGEGLWFDPAARRLVLRARVVLREGPLEHLLCLKGTKEHEAILATAAEPRKIHAGLLLTGAEPGHPVRFLPEFAPPTGTPIAIDLEWNDGGKAHKADAREWVLDERSKKPLEKDWVFAGSQLVEDPGSKEPYYLANDGDLITVANFASATLDLPFASTANDADRVFAARTEKVPPRGTGVTMFLRPRKAAPASPKGR